MQRISSEYPGYPVRVLSGDLVENPTTTGEMMRNHPTMREFFVRLAKTTGQAVGQDFLRRLEPGQGDLRMFSPDMAVPLAALKKLAPGHELEQMEAFQSAFYGEGRDVLAPEVQMRIANVDGDVFMRALEVHRKLPSPGFLLLKMQPLLQRSLPGIRTSPCRRTR